MKPILLFACVIALLLAGCGTSPTGPTAQPAALTTAPVTPSPVVPTATPVPSPSPLPATSTPLPLALQDPTVTATVACSGDPNPRLAVGGWARAAKTGDKAPLRLRNAPDFNAGVAGKVPQGMEFRVKGGPVCKNNTMWWQVSNGKLTGWAAEIFDEVWLLEPIQR